MTATQPTLQDWIENTSQRLAAFAQGQTESRSVEVAASSEACRPLGVFMILTWPEGMLQFSMRTDTAIWMQLAEDFGLLDPEEDSLCEEDLADAVAEMANMVAGRTKERLAVAGLCMSLPFCFRGHEMGEPLPALSRTDPGTAIQLSATRRIESI